MSAHPALLLPKAVSPNPDKPAVGIHIGEFHAARNPVVIHTLLGSCVAVCLFDPVNRIGGMNHILMPGRADWKNFDNAARYGINAMELLINKIMSLGGNRQRLIAKAFGGARVLQCISEANSAGRRNIEFVLMFLKREGFRIVGQDLGGEQSRKLYFHTDTGEAFLKRLPMACMSGVAREEESALKRIRKKAGEPGDITLF